MCCHKMSAILAIVIGVLALWPDLIGAVASKWVIVVLALVLLICSLKAGKCKFSMPEKAVRKKRR